MIQTAHKKCAYSILDTHLIFALLVMWWHLQWDPQDCRSAPQFHLRMMEEFCMCACGTFCHSYCKNDNIMIITDSLAPTAPTSHYFATCCHLLGFSSAGLSLQTQKLPVKQECFAKFPRIPVKIKYYILVLHTYPFPGSSWLQKKTQKPYMLTNIIMSTCTYIIKLFLIGLS